MQINKKMKLSYKCVSELSHTTVLEKVTIYEHFLKKVFVLWLKFHQTDNY